MLYVSVSLLRECTFQASFASTLLRDESAQVIPALRIMGGDSGVHSFSIHQFPWGQTMCYTSDLRVCRFQPLKLGGWWVALKWAGLFALMLTCFWCNTTVTLAILLNLVYQISSPILQCPLHPAIHLLPIATAANEMGWTEMAPAKKKEEWQQQEKG